MGKINVNDLIKSAAKGPETKKKSTTPSVTLTDKKHTEAIQDWVKADADKKDAESRKADAESKFLDDAEKARISACRTEGKYHSSVKLNDEILYGVQNKYAAIKNEDRETLESIFGDKTDTYFTEKTEISLTDAALKDEKILEKLINAVGAENFKTYFEVAQHIAPTEALHEGRAMNPELAEKADKLIEAGILRPNKASCKLA